MNNEVQILFEIDELHWEVGKVRIAATGEPDALNRLASQAAAGFWLELVKNLRVVRKAAEEETPPAAAG